MLRALAWMLMKAVAADRLARETRGGRSTSTSAGTRQQHVDTAGPQQGRHLQGHIQHHIGLPQTPDADSPRIWSSVARVDHDSIATACHGGQSGGIHRCTTWSKATRWKPSRGPPREIPFTQIIQPLGGQTGEGQFPAVGGLSPSASVDWDLVPHRGGTPPPTAWPQAVACPVGSP